MTAMSETPRTNQLTNPHRGSDFTEYMIEEMLMPTPRTDAIAYAGHNESVYIAKMTHLARELERELAAERALADRLAESLKQCLCGYTYDSDRALAAWKEARRGAD